MKKLLAQSIFWRGIYFFSVLLVNVFLSRYLKASATGNLYFITIILSFLQVVLGLGVESGITFFASGKKVQKNKLISIIITWSLAAGVAAAGLMYIYFLADASQPKALLQPYCIYALCYIAGLCLSNFVTALFYTEENYLTPNILLSIVNFAFILLIPGKDKTGTAGEVQLIEYLFFLTYLISGVLLVVTFVIRNFKYGSFGFPSLVFFKSFMRYALTVVLANIIFFLVYRIDYLFVNKSPVCTSADLGNYIQVSKLGQMLLIVPQIIASVLFPRTASGIDRAALNNQIMVIARMMSQLFLLIFIVVLLVGKWMFIFVFGETFNAMQLPMLILTPGIFTLSVLALLSAYFSGVGKVKINLHGAVIALIVMVTGDYFLVPRYGIIAAAAVSTLSYGVNLSYSLWQFYKNYSVRWVEFIRWRKTDYNWLMNLLSQHKN